MGLGSTTGRRKYSKRKCSTNVFVNEGEERGGLSLGEIRVGRDFLYFMRGMYVCELIGPGNCSVKM